jgi:protein tyrosine phosphatase type 4A
VKDVVRVCEPSYKIEELKNEGINVTDLEFDDGTPPPLRVRNIHIVVAEVPIKSSV